MAYGKSLSTIQGTIASEQKVVKKVTSTYANGDDLAAVQAKQEEVVGVTDDADYGEDLATVQDKAPVVGDSTADYKGFVTVEEPTVDTNVVTFPVVVGYMFVDADTYDVSDEDPGNWTVDEFTGTETLTAVANTLNVMAVPEENYKFKAGETTDWIFEYSA